MLAKQHNHNRHSNQQHEQLEKEYLNEDYKEQPLNVQELKHNYGYKRSILRKLMIAQRKKFMMKKEKVDFNRLKENLADTSISNFSQASGYAGNNDEKEPNGKVNSSNNNINEQAESIK